MRREARRAATLRFEGFALREHTVDRSIILRRVAALYDGSRILDATQMDKRYE